MWRQQAIIMQLLPTLLLTGDYFDILSYYMTLNSDSDITKHFISGPSGNSYFFSLKSLDSQENKTNISLGTSN